MRLASLDDRVAAVRYLDSLIARPPLTTKPFRSITYLLSLIAADIELTAIDPESPVIDGLGQVPQPDPRLYADPPLPTRTTIEQLKDALGGIFR
jgi:hypothetical protein